MDRNVCVVRGCSTKKCQRKEISIHQFPKRGSMGESWIDLSGNEQLKQLGYGEIISKRFFICRLHFEEKFIVKKQNGSSILVPGAIPTLKLAQDITLPADENSSSVANVLPALDSPLVGEISYLKEDNCTDEVRKSSVLLSVTPSNDVEEQGSAVQGLDEVEGELAVPLKTSTLTKARKIIYRPSSHSAWKEADISTPRKQQLFADFMLKREEVYKVQKKYKRYLEALSKLEFRTKYTDCKVETGKEKSKEQWLILKE